MAIPRNTQLAGGRVVDGDGSAVARPPTTASKGYQQLASLAANQTLASLCAGGVIPVGASKVLIVPTADVRVRDDGAPTAAVGLPVKAGQSFTYDGDAISDLRVYGAAILDVWFFA